MSVELLGVFGDDLTVANCARVSFGRRSETFTERDARLIRYLASHHHWSPFAHPQVRFRIRMPIFLARQWFRHTVGLTRNETSRRYVDEPPTFWRPKAWRGRAESAKQGSGAALDSATQENLAWVYDELLDHAATLYADLLSAGVCPEQARAVLPMATETEWIETGSLYAYARILRLRGAGDAQGDLAPWVEGVRDALLPHFPVSLEALAGIRGAD